MFFRGIDREQITKFILKLTLFGGRRRLRVARHVQKRLKSTKVDRYEDRLELLD